MEEHDIPPIVEGLCPPATDAAIAEKSRQTILERFNPRVCEQSADGESCRYGETDRHVLIERYIDRQTCRCVAENLTENVFNPFAEYIPIAIEILESPDWTTSGTQPITFAVHDHWSTMPGAQDAPATITANVTVHPPCWAGSFHVELPPIWQGTIPPPGGAHTFPVPPGYPPLQEPPPFSENPYIPRDNPLASGVTIRVCADDETRLIGRECWMVETVETLADTCRSDDSSIITTVPYRIGKADATWETTQYTSWNAGRGCFMDELAVPLDRLVPCPELPNPCTVVKRQTYHIACTESILSGVPASIGRPVFTHEGSFTISRSSGTGLPSGSFLPGVIRFKYLNFDLTLNEHVWLVHCRASQ